MKKVYVILFVAFIILFVANSKGQVSFNNNGSSVIINSGTHLVIKGSLINSTDGNNAIVNNGYIDISENLENNASSGNLLSSTSGQVIFLGDDSQTIGGTRSTYFTNIKIENTSNGGVTLDIKTYVENVLTLNDGVVFTSDGNELVLLSASSYSGASNASHIDGPMQKVGNTDFTFPVGDDGFIQQIGIEDLSSTETFTARYYRSAPADYQNYSGDSIHDVSSVEYWDIHPQSGSPTINLVLNWNDGSFSGINNISNILGAHHTASGWEEVGVISTSGTAGNGSITIGPINNYSFFTFGSKDNVNDPLPIQLLSFEAKLNKDVVDLNWVTATETNNDYFTIEKSNDGVYWISIMEVKGAGNSNTILEYYEKDENPFQGVSYYRLKQTDFDGEVSYSVIRTVNLENYQQVAVYPNPVNNTLTIHGINTKYEYKLYNSFSALVKEGEVSSSQVINVSSLKPGVYFLMLINNNQITQNIKIIKK